MTQKQIAKLLGVKSQSHVSLLFKGDRSITYSMAKRLKNFTNISTDFWMEAEKEDLKRILKSLNIKEVA